MNAAPEWFMNELPREPEKRAPRAAPRDPSTDERREEGQDSLQAFWGWFALGVLVFCWVAEASMCAARGF